MKPIDLQVNVNSSIELAKAEGAKLARIDAEHKQIDDKAHEYGQSMAKKVTSADKPEEYNSIRQESKENEQQISNRERKENKERQHVDRPKQINPQTSSEETAPPPKDDSPRYHLDILA